MKKWKMLLMSYYENKKSHAYLLCCIPSRFFYVVIILLYTQCLTWSILLYMQFSTCSILIHMNYLTWTILLYMKWNCVKYLLTNIYQSYFDLTTLEQNFPYSPLCMEIINIPLQCYSWNNIIITKFKQNILYCSLLRLHSPTLGVC